MKIIDRSIEIAQSIFPDEKKKTYHFAFAWKRNRLLAIGQNDPNQTSPKALKFALKFGNKHQIEYPYLHSEIDLISKLCGRIYLSSKIKVVSIRLDSNFNLRNSKPCPPCQNILNAFDVTVYYSNKDGVIHVL